MTDLPGWGFTRGAEIDPSLAVIEHLGGGTRYEVYRAWDRRNTCEVAVKVIRPHRVEDDRAMEGFERELGIASRLAHPYLVRLLRWSALPPRPYLAFDYIGAQTLADHLYDNGAVSVPEVCLLGVRMAAALHYLHTQQVLHLDVKPSNLTMGDPPRLLDLSLAHVASVPLKLRYAIGTTAYMPREQCQRGYVTPQSDIFSLGGSLYEGLSGTRPFSEGAEDAATPEEEYPQLVEDAQPLRELADVPAALDRLIMSCLAHDPARRPPSALAVALELETVLEQLGTNELFAWPRGLDVRPR
jgi:serine/threonine-protein kinase